MLVIGRNVKRNLQEQVGENMRQIGLIWQKLDGLDVYDNVIIIEDLSNLNEEQLAIVARPVSFIVYQDVVYVKKGNVGAYAVFSPYYSIEADEYITIKSSELKVQFPLGEVTISNLEFELYDKNEVDALIAEVYPKIYPIGAIYMSTVSTSPASLFGGTWEQLEDRFLLGAGSSYSAGATGGEATHILTINEMPNHHHTIETYSGGVGDGGSAIQRGWSGSTTQVYPATTNEGGNNAHNNMPPYLVVYMWKRVA